MRCDTSHHSMSGCEVFYYCGSVSFLRAFRAEAANVVEVLGELPLAVKVTQTRSTTYLTSLTSSESAQRTAESGRNPPLSRVVLPGGPASSLHVPRALLQLHTPRKVLA